MKNWREGAILTNDCDNLFGVNDHEPTKKGCDKMEFVGLRRELSGRQGLCMGAIFAVLLCFSATAGAATYFSKAGTKNTTFDDGQSLVWANETGAEEFPDQRITKDDGNTYVVMATKKLYNRYDGPSGVTVCFGKDGKEVGTEPGVVAVYVGKGLILNFPYVHAYGLDVRCSDLGGMGTLEGTWELISSGNVFQLYGWAIAEGDTRGIAVKGALVGEADVELRLGSKFSATSGTAKFVFSGDNSGFKGSIYAAPDDGAKMSESNRGLLQLQSANAMGDSSVKNAAAVKISPFWVLEIDPVVQQTANRGIALDFSNADDIAFIDVKEGKDIGLVSPVSGGSCGTFAKIGSGKLSLNGSVAVGMLDVREGTLVVGKAASYDPQTVFHVAPGATLLFELGATVPSQVNCEEGGTVAYQTVVVPFDGSSTTEGPVAIDCPSIAPGYRLPIRLSCPVTIPFTEKKRYAVLTISGGQFSEEDFVDATAKTAGLPTTWFEVEKDEGTGNQTVYMIARPALGATAQNIVAAQWTDSAVMHADADYFNIGGVNEYSGAELRVGTGGNGDSFKGECESLTVAKWNGSSSPYFLNDFYRTLNLKEYRFYADTALRLSYAVNADPDTARRYVKGMIYVDESATDDHPFAIELNTDTQTHTDNSIQGDIGGAGCLVIKARASSSAETPCTLALDGDNEGFLGQLRLHTDSANRSVLLKVKDGFALGGSPKVADPAGFYMNTALSATSQSSRDGLLTLQADASVEFADEKRGWTINYGRLRVIDEATMTLKSPLVLENKLIKDGAGTLAMGCTTTGAGTQFAVKEGYVMPLSADCCSNLDVTFSEGAGIAIDCLAAMRQGSAGGLIARSCSVEQDKTKIKVRLDNAAAAVREPGRSLMIPICTVAGESSDMTSDFEIQKPVRGVVVGGVVREELPGGAVRYGVECTRAGILLIVR